MPPASIPQACAATPGAAAERLQRPGGLRSKLGHRHRLAEQVALNQVDPGVPHIFELRNFFDTFGRRQQAKPLRQRQGGGNHRGAILPLQHALGE